MVQVCYNFSTNVCHDLPTGTVRIELEHRRQSDDGSAGCVSLVKSREWLEPVHRRFVQIKHFSEESRAAAHVSEEKQL